MRSAILILLTLTVTAPLAAQDPATVERRRATERSVESERAMRADEARLHTDVERSLKETGRLIELRSKDFERHLSELQPAIERRMRALEPLLARTIAMAVRPRLGVSVALDARDTDRYGAYLNGVTPGGPADKAGLRAGDIITKIGKSSLTTRDNMRRPEGESVPGLKLIEIVGKLEAGKPVDVEYRRGSADRKTKVTPDESDEVAFTMSGPGGSAGAFWRRSADSGEVVALRESARSIVRADSLRRNLRWAPTVGGVFSGTAPSSFSYAFTMGGPLDRLELTALNASLGSYFGTTEGVLVINVPETDNYGLMAGDVITAVDGRKVTSPRQLMRIMGTYEKAEEMKLNIMRQKRSETVSIKLP